MQAMLLWLRISHASCACLPTAQQDPLCFCLLQLASAWWSSRVKALQRDSGLVKKQVNGMAVLEAVPQAPAYLWPADPALRKIGSGGQGSVY